MRIKYSMDEMKFISIFENVTKASFKDCITTDQGLLFIVPPEMMGRAIGKEGSTIKQLERILRKRVKVVAFDPDLPKFIENLVYPAKIKSIRQEDGVVTIQAQDLKTRGQLIGRGASTLRGFEADIKRYFPIKELRVA